METIELSIAAKDQRTASRMTSELKTFLRDYCGEAEISPLANPGHQDTGTVLQIVLAAPAVVTLAAGIAAWMKRQPNAELTIKPSGEVIAKKISSADAVKIAKLALNEE